MFERYEIVYCTYAFLSFICRLGKKNFGPPVLLAISMSRYVEKVRWSMQYLKIPFVEEQDIGLFGFFFLGRHVSELV